MKNKNLRRIVLLCGVVAFLAFLLWPHREPGSSYLASLGISIPTSSVVTYKEGPFMLKGCECMVAFQLPLTQIPALIKQMRTKEDYEIGTYPQVVLQSVSYTSYVAKFFAAVPKNATGATFRVMHDRGEKNEWATYCSFAIDKSTGRVWFFGQEVY